jgi:phosphoribosylformylglycinamidine cyclo-ligase
MSERRPLTYREAGVDIDAGAELVERIKPAVKRTMRPEVLAGLGGFGALFALPPGKYRAPVLVSGTDGVGTKLKLAQQLNRHESIGIDLVAMCVNDVLVQGAESLFFLDYFACGKLDVETAATVIQGIARGCEIAGCALVGGETAEMPDMYGSGEYDLAGFCVGAVEREALNDGSAIKAGHKLVGIASSGPHSNGYSLIRKILARSNPDLTMSMGEVSLADALMMPTRIYVRPMLELLEKISVAGMAHITGGGLSENIIRVVPEGLALHIDSSSWVMPEVFKWLQREGALSNTEMWRTFNCGIGYVLILDPAQVASAQAHVKHQGWDSFVIGEVCQQVGDERVAIR